MSYKQQVEDCKKGLDQLKYMVDKYVNDYDIYKTERERLDNNRKTALNEFNDATLLLKNTPKTKTFSGQGYYGTKTSDSCRDICGRKIYYGNTFHIDENQKKDKDFKNPDPVQINSLPFENVVVSSYREEPCSIGKSSWQCDHVLSNCFCDVPNESEWNKRKENEQVKYYKYIEKRNEYLNYLDKNKPSPPSSIFIRCCINKNDCDEGSRCLGIIQGCEQGLSAALTQMSEQERVQLENNFLISNNTILNDSSNLIRDLNNDINTLESNLNNIKNEKKSTNKDANTIFNNIISIYTQNENLYNNIKNKIDDFNKKKTQAYNNKISTSPTSQYLNGINLAYSSILINFNEIIIKLSSATDTYILTKIESEITNNYKKIYDNIIKIQSDINNIKTNINKELINISLVNDKINNKKNSMIEEDINTIGTLSSDANKILDTINNYLKSYKENIDKVKYYIDILKDSIFINDAQKLNNSILNEEKILMQEYNKNKNLIDEIKKTYTNLKNDLDNYKNMLNLKKDIDNLIPSIDNNLKLINNLYDSINNININNENDLIKLNNIKNDIQNLEKKVETFNNFLHKIETFSLDSDSKSLNNIKDLTNKYFNTLSTNSIFFNKIKELNDNINNLVEINQKKYTDITNMINNINNIYYDKKSKYINNSIIDKGQLNSDLLLYKEIKKNESSQKPTNNMPNYNILYIIIIIGIILIIFLYFFL